MYVLLFPSRNCWPCTGVLLRILSTLQAQTTASWPHKRTVCQLKPLHYVQIKLLASARSKGKQLGYAGAQHEVHELTADAFGDVDIALFSAGGDRSKE